MNVVLIVLRVLKMGLQMGEKDVSNCKKLQSEVLSVTNKINGGPMEVSAPGQVPCAPGWYSTA